MPKYINKFSSPEYIEETILDESGGVVGTLRIKPSSILWKPKGAQKFYSVPLDKFTQWVTDDSTKANRTAS